MKSFRYLLRSYIPNYLSILGISIAFLVLAALSGAAQGREGPLTSITSGYFLMLPAVVEILAFSSAIGLTTSCLNTALTFGATRQEYFRGLCALQLVSTLLYWGICLALNAVPGLLGWSERFYTATPSYTTPLMLLAMSWLGCSLGGVYLKHRWVAGLLSGLLIWFCMMFTPFTQFSWMKWGDVELVTALVSLVSIVVFALWTYQGIRKAVVRA